MFTKFNMQNQRGSSLLEAIIAIAILGIAVGSATTFFVKSGSVVRSENAREGQQLIAQQIMAALANTEALTNTVNMLTTGSNKKMRACALGDEAKAGNCDVTTAVSAEEVEIADAVLKGGLPVYLSGPKANWDVDGKPCDPKVDKNCIFASRVKFWATCEGTPPAAKCPGKGQARFLNFKFIIDVKKEYLKGKATALKPYPSEKSWNSSEPMGAMRFRTNNIVMRLGGTCGDDKQNQRMIGVDKDGRVICGCINGSIAKKGETCSNQECTKGYLMVGFKQENHPDGSKTLAPLCLSQKECEPAVDFDPRCPCKLVNLSPPAPVPPDAGDCGVGFWMVHVNYGECVATEEKNGKGAPETVKCSEHTAKCCKIDAK